MQARKPKSLSLCSCEAEMCAINVTITVAQIELSSATFEFLKELQDGDTWKSLRFHQDWQSSTNQGSVTADLFTQWLRTTNSFSIDVWLVSGSLSETDLVTWQLNLAVEVQPSAWAVLQRRFLSWKAMLPVRLCTELYSLRWAQQIKNRKSCT